MPDTPPPYEPPKLDDRRTRPLGLLPRHIQPLMVTGIALVMVVIIAFFGRTPPTSEKPTAARTPGGAGDDSIQARIEDYRARIDKQAQQLAAEQGQLAKTRQALEAGGGDARPHASPYRASSLGTQAAIAEDPTAAALTQEHAAIAAAKLRRRYESDFAPSIVSSRRETPAAALTAQTNNPGTKSTGVKTHRLLEGTIIETALANALDGTFSGPVDCRVTTNVYSQDREHLLIPSGSRVLGEVRPVASQGESRLAVAFHRLVLPNGSSFSLKDLPGLSQEGETGLVDKVNRHYGRVFGAALAIGAIGGLNASTVRYGDDAAAVDVYRQGVTSSLSQSSLRILDRFLDVLPTFTVRAGARVKVYLTESLDLPSYDPNAVPREL